MNKNFVRLVFMSSLLFYACTAADPVLKKVPASDLGHIDIILDSATWHAIKSDSFIQNEFGVLNIDTGRYAGKASYDLYLLGQLSFLHLSLAKEFWADQQGGGAVIFQTQKPGEKEALLDSWKQHYKDSLDITTFHGTDFTLDEVMAWYPRDSSKPKGATMFANLTSYSKDAYKKWGISDSIINAGLAMKQFMGDWGGEALKTKLFQSITELHMTINDKEFKEVSTALLAVGYLKDGKVFTQKGNPSIFIIVEDEARSKFSKVKFALARSIAKREIAFSTTAKLALDGHEAWLLIDQAANH